MDHNKHKRLANTGGEQSVRIWPETTVLHALSLGDSQHYGEGNLHV